MLNRLLVPDQGVSNDTEVAPSMLDDLFVYHSIHQSTVVCHEHNRKEQGYMNPLQDTLHDAIVLSIFDFILGFVVLYVIGLLIRGMGSLELLDRKRVKAKAEAAEAKVELKSVKEV
jgi:hypothetical protein